MARRSRGPTPDGRSGTAAGGRRIHAGMEARLAILNLICAAALLAAAVAAAFLVYQHFGAHLPGCGPSSPCASLERSAWGRVPAVGWPVSFVGLAYFASLLLLWIVSKGRLAGPLRALVPLGALFSLILIGVMIAKARICPYCLTVHLANLVFLALSELRARSLGPRHDPRGKGGRPQMTSRAAAFAFGIAFLAVTAGLAVAEVKTQGARAAAAEIERAESRDRILAQAASNQGAGLVDHWGAAGFAGRYRLGPESAVIRIVMLTDYQCPDCRRLEEEAMAIYRARKDVSISIKHFPMCKDAAPGVPCNKYATQSLHPNACNGARAAEAAGILGGDKAFWVMHRWLFEHKGLFTAAQLDEGCRSAGLDPGAFRAVMAGPETLRRVQADVEEGYALGLHYTPMIFVNGVEFRGWQTIGALAKTVEEVARTNPPPRTASADRPVLASQKLIDDWRTQPVTSMPPDMRSWSLGIARGERAAVEVILFGDYDEPYTAAADRSIREFVGKNPGARYIFRHYPIMADCNPTLPANVRPEAIHKNACVMARAAEAAGSIGGNEAYWKMHAWLFENQKGFSTDALRAAARGMRLDPDRLFGEMGSAAVGNAIAEDSRAAQRLGLRAVPWVYINDRYVPRTSRDGQEVLSDMLRAAMQR